MLLKPADSKDTQIAELEAKIRRANGSYRDKLQQDLRFLKAGLKAEKDAAYLIDFDYEKSTNWAVIHDLRLEVGGRVAQIDHLLINRFLEVYVLETKSFHSTLRITDEGEFLRRVDAENKFKGMPSPLEQNERHIAVLKDAFREIELPTRLGVKLFPTFYSLILVSAEAVVERPRKFDTSRVIKSDSLKRIIDKQMDEEGLLATIGSMARLVDKGTLYAIGRRLANMHKPLIPTPEANEMTMVVAQTSSTPSRAKSASTIGSGPLVSPASVKVSGPLVQPAATQAELSMAPKCKQCAKSAGSIQYGQYGYYFKCGDCGGNTSMKWECGTPGHKPRVRKDGPKFYRECEGCKISVLFHENADG